MRVLPRAFSANLSKKIRSSGMPFALSTLMQASIMRGLPQR